MPARPAIAVRCKHRVGRAADRHQHAQRVLDRISGDDVVRASTRCGPAASPRAPVASAARSRSAWTAGIAAVPGRIMPSASAIEAIVLAVPITAQVPAVVARLPSISWISSASISPARYLRPEAPAIGAGAEPLAMPARGHHRPGDELDRRPVGGDRAHQLRRHGLVAAADQHHRIHRLGADHLLGVDRHQVAEHQAGRVEKHFAERDRRKGQAAAPPAAKTPRLTASISSGKCRWQLL